MSRAAVAQSVAVDMLRQAQRLADQLVTALGDIPLSDYVQRLELTAARERSDAVCAALNRIDRSIRRELA